MPEPGEYRGTAKKSLWMKRQMEYFNMSEKERAKLGLKFPSPSEFGVNPRDPEIQNFIIATLGGDKSKLEGWQEASDIHEMIAEQSPGGIATSGVGQLAKRLAELGYSQ